MAASLLPSFPPLSIAVAALDASDDTLAILYMLVLFVPLAFAYWSTLISHSKPARSKASHSQASARRKPEVRETPPPPPATSSPSEVPAPWPRVIRLYSTTPGQSPNEYNIGDNQGRAGRAGRR